MEGRNEEHKPRDRTSYEEEGDDGGEARDETRAADAAMGGRAASQKWGAIRWLRLETSSGDAAGVSIWWW